jgi:hypothetical protein
MRIGYTGVSTLFAALGAAVLIRWLKINRGLDWSIYRAIGAVSVVIRDRIVGPDDLENP